MYAVINMAYDTIVRTGTREQCAAFAERKNARLDNDVYTFTALRDYMTGEETQHSKQKIRHRMAV